MSVPGHKKCKKKFNICLVVTQPLLPNTPLYRMLNPQQLSNITGIELHSYFITYKGAMAQ